MKFSHFKANLFVNITYRELPLYEADNNEYKSFKYNCTMHIFYLVIILNNE